VRPGQPNLALRGPLHFLGVALCPNLDASKQRQVAVNWRAISVRILSLAEVLSTTSVGSVVRFLTIGANASGAIDFRKV